MRVLLTGGTGYLGYPVGRALAAAGARVVRLDTGFFTEGTLPPGDDAPGRDDGCETIRADTRDLAPGDLAGYDAVVHLAELSNDSLGNLDPALTVAINERATARVAQLARRDGVRRFVYVSSCSVYGATDGTVVDERSRPSPLTQYARSKVAAEGAVLELGGPAFTPVVLRLATAYGPSPALRLDLVVNELVHAAVSTARVVVRSDGTAWRPFVHVRDVAETIARAVRADRDDVAGQIVNVGSEQTTRRIADLAREVCDRFGAELVIESETTDNRSYRVSFAKLRTLFGSDVCAQTLTDSMAELGHFVVDNRSELAARGEDRFRRLPTLAALMRDGRLSESLTWLGERPTARSRETV
jgi:nucleoside-diphosphate-sugar epimerase